MERGVLLLVVQFIPYEQYSLLTASIPRMHQEFETMSVDSSKTEYSFMHPQLQVQTTQDAEHRLQKDVVIVVGYPFNRSA